MKTGWYGVAVLDWGLLYDEKGLGGWAGQHILCIHPTAQQRLLCSGPKAASLACCPLPPHTHTGPSAVGRSLLMRRLVAEFPDR